MINTAYLFSLKEREVDHLSIRKKILVRIVLVSFYFVNEALEEFLQVLLTRVPGAPRNTTRFPFGDNDVAGTVLQRTTSSDV